MALPPQQRGRALDIAAKLMRANPLDYTGYINAGVLARDFRKRSTKLLPSLSSVGMTRKSQTHQSNRWVQVNLALPLLKLTLRNDTVLYAA